MSQSRIYVPVTVTRKATTCGTQCDGDMYILERMTPVVGTQTVSAVLHFCIVDHCGWFRPNGGQQSCCFHTKVATTGRVAEVSVVSHQPM